jgi:hypothetical protein
MSSSSRLELSFAPERECQIFIRRLLALLDEAMKNKELALLDAEQHPRNSIAHVLNNVQSRYLFVQVLCEENGVTYRSFAE